MMIRSRPASENVQVPRQTLGKGAGVIPTRSSKDTALSNVGNLSRPSLLSSKAKQSAIERQRAAAERLTKGYSVLGGKATDKENAAARSNQRPVIGKENPMFGRNSIIQTARSTLSSLRVSSTQSFKEDKAIFRVPAKPVKQKKTEGLAKCPSVTLLPSNAPVKPEPAIAPVPDLISELEGLFINEDKKHEHDEFLLGMYAMDVFRYLKQLEAQQCVRKEYLTTEHNMTGSMRAVLVDWMYEVHKSFDMLQDTVQIAIALLDRFMQDNPRIARDELQLVGVTCVFIASKYEEMYPPSVTDLEEVSANACPGRQILRMEQKIMKSINFNLGRPTPIQFLRRFGRTSHVTTNTYTLSKYIIDLALVQYKFSGLPPSQLAAAAIYLAIYLQSDSPFDEVWTKKLMYFTGMTANIVQPIVYDLAQVLVIAPTQKEKCVQEIYRESKHNSVSVVKEATYEKLKALLRGR